MPRVSLQSHFVLLGLTLPRLVRASAHSYHAFRFSAAPVCLWAYRDSHMPFAGRWFPGVVVTSSLWHTSEDVSLDAHGQKSLLGKG